MAVRTRMLEADLGIFGENICAWRKLRGLTAEMTAERAGITRATLRAIESGTGTARLDNVMAVLRVLDISDNIIQAANPLETDLGRARVGQMLSARVVPRKVTNDN